MISEEKKKIADEIRQTAEILNAKMEKASVIGLEINAIPIDITNLEDKHKKYRWVIEIFERINW